MKLKIISLCIGLAIFLSSVASAQENDKDTNKEGQFTEHKAKILNKLGIEKSIVEKEISCVNSSQKQDDLKKCQEEKRAGMEKLRESRRAERKEHLQKELKKLEEEVNTKK